MPHSHTIVWDESVPSKRATSHAGGGGGGRNIRVPTGSSRTASAAAAAAGGSSGSGGGFGGGRSPFSRPPGSFSSVPESKDEDYDEEEGGNTFGDGGSLGGVSLTLGRKHDLRNVGALPVLRLSLWGREVITKDKPLGVGLVDLASLPSDGKASLTWETLEPATGMDPDMTCGRYVYYTCLFCVCCVGLFWVVGVVGLCSFFGRILGSVLERNSKRFTKLL